MARSLEDIGATLKNAREEARLSEQQAADQMGIRLRYLRAIEKGHFQELPGKIYSEGYIRNYAKLLKLPTAELIREYREIAKEVKLPEPERISAERKDNELLPARRTVVLSLLVMIGVYLTWYFLEHRVAPETYYSAQEQVPENIYDSNIAILARENTEIVLYRPQSPEPWMRLPLSTGESFFVPYVPGLKLAATEQKALTIFVNGEVLRAVDKIHKDGFISLDQYELERVVEEEQRGVNPITEKLKRRKHATH